MTICPSLSSATLLFSSHSRRWRVVSGGGRPGVVSFSSHSNARILKSNRRTRQGRRGSTCVEEEDEESDDEEVELLHDDDLEFDGNQFCGSQRSPQKDGKVELRKRVDMNFTQGSKPSRTLTKRPNLQNLTSRTTKKGLMDLDGYGQHKTGKFTQIRFKRLIEEMDFDERWFPLIDYLSTFGLKESHFVSIYERHMPSLQINLASAQERLTFLLGVGVKRRDIRRILVRQPQILEYTVERNMMAHIRFLLTIGIPSSRIGQIITAAPSLFSYSVEHSLKPRVRYLVEDVGIKATGVSKVVQLSPQVLVQRIDNSWNSRLSFMSKELGAPRDSIVKMVTKHPQLLHYSIENGIFPRINFLRSIGMSNSDIVKVLTNLTQVLSLSLEENLKPKYLYLVNELHNEVQSLIKYPMYLSLSLDQRIRPRHRFLVSLKKAPKGPFPLSTFVPTDESFCQQWAGTSLEKYLAFRQSLLVTSFAKKYERTR
ncbi:hypothetical protein AXF42_Ash004381 [Apostasia shenzhenica]|uniref:Transcription termination factor MTERF9, chloroplastic n=1 Tax=Apostasia shenzhenica TaxID=1088818 RepID=A0A2I0A2S7_9ASPA|nr:hypothetical protein AXF42_Ash004381 [Apostasia shenzhenica]